MLGPVRLYIEGALAIAIMATLAVISGFVAAAISGNRMLALATTALVFVLTGVVLALRLRRMARAAPAVALELDS
jgi:hypothetical protein